MTVLKQSHVLDLFIILLVVSILLASTVDAEPCRREGSLLSCQIDSESYHQNPNESLEYISTLTAIDSVEEDMQIDIMIPYMYLTKKISFKNLHSLTISGDTSSSTIINCTHSDSSAGIMIDNVRNLTLKHLALIHCGSQLCLRGNKKYNSALIVRSCGNTYITNTVINESRGIGMMIINHQEGLVHISSSNFTKNAIFDEDNILGGGGIYIGEFQQNYSNRSPILFEFEHCVFERNVAHTRRYYSFYTNEFGNVTSGHGQGGGIFMAFENNINRHINIFISNCKFIKNLAFFGGGLSVKIGRGSRQLSIIKVTVAIENSSFESNGCGNATNTSTGGGVHLSYHWINSTGCEYKLWNVNFSNNCAVFGGGAFFYSNRHNSEDNSLLFDDCTFEKNNAHIGSAIDMTSSSSTIKHSTNLAIIPVFRDCTFLENRVFINLESLGTAAAGIGTIYASLCDVKFEGENQFENNLGTAVYMINGVADFSTGSATFDSNQGIRGGAIALFGTSFMIVGPNRDYMFCNNSALYQGGAIFNQMIDTHDFTLYRNCFIQYNDDNNHLNTAKYWNTSITFRENTAKVGKAIFTTSLNPCLFVNNNTDSSPYYITVPVREIFSIRGIEINESEVATEGARLQSEQSELQYYIPGKRYKHGVTIKDDTEENATEPLRVNIKGSSNASVKVDSTLSLYVGEKVQLKGNPGDQAYLSLQTVSARQSYITLSVEIAHCPPGFKLENFECICNSKEHYGLLECDQDFYSILSPGLWTGNVPDEKSGKIELVTSVCPRTFCDYNNTLDNEETIVSVIRLPSNNSHLETAICGERRQGILCGICASSYTTHYHSPDFQCKPVQKTLCKVGWLFYILSELVPVTVVFITVIAFNISFTSGAVNGFILFSQILLSLNIDASGIIRFPRQKEVTQGYQFLYGFLNLDFFTIDRLSFCLWSKATALDMLAFKYITIVYALSLVILVIWFMNKCGGRCLSKWWRITTVKSSIIHGISAFLIICYSQCITVSHSLLNGVEVWRKVNSDLNISKRVWHNGNMTYFGLDHLPYAIPALLCLSTVGVLPPLLLLVYPLFNKIMAFFGLEESKFMQFLSQKIPISKIKPLLDTFQGCFKDNLRFFAGLYFIYRWIAPFVNSITSSLGTAYITYEICLILILTLHALFQPYQKRVHNIIDTLLFTNLLLINSITCIHYYLFQSQENRHTIKEKIADTAAVQMTLIYLPLFIVMLYLLVVVCKHAYLFYRKKHGSLSIFSKEIEQPVTHKLRRLRAAVQSISSMNGDICVNDEELPHRFIAGEVSYEHFEDTDCAWEMLTDNKSMQDIVTY